MKDERDIQAPRRRAILKTGLATASLVLGGGFALPTLAQGRKVTKVHDFSTGADIAKAEQEGEVVFYTHDGEPAAAGLMEAFMKDFPKIKGSYVRAQTGALYSKILAERSAGRYAADVIQFSELTTALDFQKLGGYERYVSPETAAYSPDHLSNPVGDFFWVGVGFAGISYNTEKVKPEDAPKTWKDMLNPRWANGVSVKQATSGMQFVQWYELRRLYGDSFWTEFAKLRPRGFDSRAQLFDRLGKGDDKAAMLAEYQGFLLQQQKGSPIKFVAPADGLTAGPNLQGVVSKAPHPEAARLFVDWMMSLRGQSYMQSNKFLLYGSVRKDAPPMPDGTKLSDYKLLIPTDIAALKAAHPKFLKEWNGMLGL
jgi:iron(III) transport system substrate-binding protein